MSRYQTETTDKVDDLQDTTALLVVHPQAIALLQALISVEAMGVLLGQVTQPLVMVEMTMMTTTPTPPTMTSSKETSAMVVGADHSSSDI